MRTKYYAFLLLLLISNFAFAFDVGSVTYTSCKRLDYPREKVEAVYEQISEKKEECLANGLDCKAYHWPANVKDSSGETLTSNFTIVNLWELQRTYGKALDCDFCKRENPNQECGITEFSN
jgi:hypothetical protein